MMAAFSLMVREVLVVTGAGMCGLLTAMLLEKRCPEAYRNSGFKLKGPLLYIAPTVGILICLGAIATLLLEMADKTPLILFGAWLVFGVVYMLIRRKEVTISPEEGWR